MNKRNGFLSIVKLLFCNLIILMHWNIPSAISENIFGGGYLYVDFFFILQGFYLIRNWEQKDVAPCDMASKYLMNRLERFLPAVMTAALLMLIVQIFACEGPGDAVMRIIEFFVQISFISQLVPFMTLGAGGVFWFLSASVIIGTLVVFVCQSCGKKIVMILPFIASMLYNYIYTATGNLNVWWQMFFDGTVRASLVRAAAGILMGVLSKEVALKIKQLQLKVWIRLMLRLISIFMVLSTVYVIMYHPHSKYDFYMIIIFASIIIIADVFWMGESNYITDFLDKMCMPMYIFQVFCILMLSRFMLSDSTSAVLLIVVDFTAGLIWVILSPKLSAIKKLIIID